MSAASSQVTALCVPSTTIKEGYAKSSDLRKLARTIQLRPTASSEEARTRKFAVETGFDVRLNTYRTLPLEPWDQPAAQPVYARIRRADTITVDDFTPLDLEHLRWLEGQQLIGIDPDGTVLMLDDPEGKKSRRYPGAGIPDKQAAIGKQLRDLADPFVLAAFSNLSRGKPVSRIPAKVLAELIVHNGIKVPARLICQEANALMRKRRDLDEYKFLSVDTCARVLKRLREAGDLTEVEKPRAVRTNRQWIAIPRVYAIPEGERREAWSRAVSGLPHLALPGVRLQDPSAAGASPI